MTIPTSVKELLELSPPVLLGVFLYFVGIVVRKSPIPNWIIPILMLVLGALVYPLIAEVGKVSFCVANPTAFNAVIGACVGGMSVCVDKGIKDVVGRFSKSRRKKSLWLDEDYEP